MYIRFYYNAFLEKTSMVKIPNEPPSKPPDCVTPFPCRLLSLANNNCKLQIFAMLVIVLTYLYQHFKKWGKYPCNMYTSTTPS